MEQFTYFWNGEFSQWYGSKFSLLVPIPNNQQGHLAFCHAEQAMMYYKAAFFQDWDSALAIMSTTDPKECKALGRMVKPFDRDKWNSVCRDFVREINYAKFTQNDRLKKVLLATAGTTLVEASPMDKIWGIGLVAQDPRAKNRATWLGTNWLGEALTQVREQILKE